jgi:nitroreductase
MDVFEAIEARRSIRRYRDESVPQDIINKILEAARIAPSSSNTQSWKFKVVTDAATRHELREIAFGQKFVEQAPAVIVCCLDMEAFKERGKRTLELMTRGRVRPNLEMMFRSVRASRNTEFDEERVLINGAMNVAISVQNMVLAAEALGLGTCWVRAFSASAVERLLDLPDTLRVLALLPLGYPDESPPARPRKSLEEILI